MLCFFSPSVNIHKIFSSNLLISLLLLTQVAFLKAAFVKYQLSISSYQPNILELLFFSFSSPTSKKFHTNQHPLLQKKSISLKTKWKQLFKKRKNYKIININYFIAKNILFDHMFSLDSINQKQKRHRKLETNYTWKKKLFFCYKRPSIEMKKKKINFFLYEFLFIRKQYN